MIFRETPLSGAFLVEPERREDDRGFFARTWCADEYTRRGLDPRIQQCSISANSRRGTLRGMHWQAAPHLEAKTVRCTAGRIHDVIVDLRPESETRLRWFAVELSAENRLALYVPPLFAHGFITLADGSEVEYAISTPYVAEAARGLRWDDPVIGIEWPLEPTTISGRDRSFPLLERTRA